MTDRATARHLRIPADIDRMAEVRAFVRETALDAGAPPTCIDDLLQAVDEAATNVVLHGYRGLPGDIDVTVDPRGENLVVTVTDSAPTFDPTAASSSAVSSRSRPRMSPAMTSPAITKRPARSAATSSTSSVCGGAAGP